MSNVTFFWNVCTALATTAEMLSKPLQQITIEAMKHAMRMTLAKIGSPTPQGLVDSGY